MPPRSSIYPLFKRDYIMETLEVPRIIFNRLQVLIGLTILLLGSLVYVVDRPPGQTYFVDSSRISISLYDILPNLFGLVGNIMPAFIHVFSFILITAGFLSYKKRGCLLICLSWFLVDCAFEVGQKFNAWSSMLIPDWLAGIPFLENTENYLLEGTFDILDVVAIAFGTAIAYLVLLATNELGEIS